MSLPEDAEGSCQSASQLAAAPCLCEPGTQDPSTQPRDELLSRVGQLTRRLYEILRELGYDRDIERAVNAVPDARQRVDYVLRMTEQAATRSLNAVEIARPLQEQIEARAGQLALDWERFFCSRLDHEAVWQLAEDTCRFLEGARQSALATSAQLHEILIAQEFQDLTGQVIRKLAQAVLDLEQQLLKLLIEQVQPTKRQQLKESSVLDGPVIDADLRQDVVTSQEQVDDLLESLGF